VGGGGGGGGAGGGGADQGGRIRSDKVNWSARVLSRSCPGSSFYRERNQVHTHAVVGGIYPERKKDAFLFALH